MSIGIKKGEGVSAYECMRMYYVYAYICVYVYFAMKIINVITMNEHEDREKG